MTVCELTTDLRGVITQASEDTAALLAIEHRWLVRKPLASFIAEGDRRRFRRLLLELEDGERTRDGNFLLLNRTQDEIPATLAATHRAGAVAWTVALSREEVSTPPSEGPEADRIVQLRERQFHWLLTRLPQGVVIINKRLGVEYANPAALRLIGAGNVRRGEPLPDPWGDPSLRELGASLFTSHPAIGRLLVSAGGRTISVEGLQSTHGPTAVLLLEDVTQRERTRLAERQFVENAAHELRTPVAAIASAIDVLEAGAAEDVDARAQFLGHIRVQGERLRRLSTSLLTLARFQSGDERVRLDLVPAKPLLEDVAAELPAIGEVELQVEAPPDLAVLADPDLLHHAIGNIATNAIQHTHEGKIVLLARDVGQSAEIEIRDSGSGMSAQDLEHAFDRFYRADGSSSTGFGLGLAIAREAVQAMGGTMSVESGPGGTTVRIWLPSARLTH